ncbi:hypothetical protein L484_016578 [Morus notabilis]|uniref:MATH domain-containing protein n=1 Tax=Morus notabilis TaxID=981085 RepID=W9QKF4_9ROSA|nr:hypothetical protein L484_016578 [Morus notabilis]
MSGDSVVVRKAAAAWSTEETQPGWTRDRRLGWEEMEISVLCRKGFSLLPLETFKDPSNGYLVDDSCMFGAEVFVIKNTGKWESLSFVKAPNIKNSTFTWEVENFSELDEDFYLSEMFSVGRTLWKLKIYPNGLHPFKGKALSLYLAPTLCLCGSNNATKAATYAEFELRLLDTVNGKNTERSVEVFLRRNKKKKEEAFTSESEDGLEEGSQASSINVEDR